MLAGGVCIVIVDRHTVGPEGVQTGVVSFTCAERDVVVASLSTGKLDDSVMVGPGSLISMGRNGGALVRLTTSIGGCARVCERACERWREREREREVGRRGVAGGSIPPARRFHHPPER